MDSTAELLDIDRRYLVHPLHHPDEHKAPLFVTEELTLQLLQARRHHPRERFPVACEIAKRRSGNEPKDQLRALRRERIAENDVGERREKLAICGRKSSLGHALNVCHTIIKR